MLALGCGTAATPDAVESSTGAPATTSSSTTASVSSSTDGGDDTTSTSSDEGDVPKMDTPPPGMIESCDVSRSEQIDLVVTTPEGPFAVTHAWWGWENCCIRDPWLLLVERDTLEVQDGVALTPDVEVQLSGTWEHTGPWIGPMTTTLSLGHFQSLSQFDTGAELLEPLDPDAGDGAQPDLSASFAVEGEGWSVQGTVRAPHCALVDTQGCPCE
jgi:hypothetical protein